MFSPGIWWSALSVNRFSSIIQVLQMASYGVRPLRVFNRRQRQLKAMSASWQAL